MPSITVNVNDNLKERMDNHPEINWSEVTRQAIQEKIQTLEVMDELTSESELTESDVQEIADKINESGRKRVDDGIGVGTTNDVGHRRQRRHLCTHR